MYESAPLIPESDWGADRHNVTDWCLAEFHSRYQDSSITKDDIWEYLYGVMHAPDWRSKYRHDLSRSLPRVPLANDFAAFRAAGRALMDLHVGYETVPECPDVACLVDNRPDEGQADPGAYHLERKMRWGGSRSEPDRSVLHVTSRCQLIDIPPEAHTYQVSGRSPLAWAVDQLVIKHDKSSYITDDPNGWHVWAAAPFELIRHLRRLAYVGVESTRIINALPPSL